MALYSTVQALAGDYQYCWRDWSCSNLSYCDKAQLLGRRVTLPRTSSSAQLHHCTGPL